MSFIVRNLPMPKRCVECPCFWQDSEMWMMSHCQAGSKYVEDPMVDVEQTKLPDDCPAFEIKAWEDI